MTLTSYPCDLSSRSRGRARLGTARGASIERPSAVVWMSPCASRRWGHTVAATTGAALGCRGPLSAVAVVERRLEAATFAERALDWRVRAAGTRAATSPFGRVALTD